MRLAGGREAASFTKAFLLSAPCHWSSAQLDLQIPWVKLPSNTCVLLNSDNQSQNVDNPGVDQCSLDSKL